MIRLVATGKYVPPDCPCDVEPADQLSEEFSEIGRQAGLSALSVPLYGAFMFGLGMLCHWAWPS